MGHVYLLQAAIFAHINLAFMTFLWWASSACCFLHFFRNRHHKNAVGSKGNNYPPFFILVFSFRIALFTNLIKCRLEFIYLNLKRLKYCVSSYQKICVFITVSWICYLFPKFQIMHFSLYFVVLFLLKPYVALWILNSWISLLSHELLILAISLLLCLGESWLVWS